MHSHDHGSVRSDAPPSQGFALDPVCGMPLDTSAVKYKHSHAGQRWYFCSQHCLDKFAAEPERYAKAAGKPAPLTGAAPGAIYTCPMHPEIRQVGPCNCPKCGMALEPVAPSADDQPNPELVDMARRFWIGLALTVPVLGLAMAGHSPGLQAVVAESEIPNWTP